MSKNAPDLSELNGAELTDLLKILSAQHRLDGADINTGADAPEHNDPRHRLAGGIALRQRSLLLNRPLHQLIFPDCQ